MIRALHGDGAHHGRLPRSRSPPAPKTQISRPLAELARRLQHDVERVRRMRVVDDDRERLPLVDRLEPSRHRRASSRIPAASSSSSMSSRIPAAITPSTFSTLNRPRSGVSISIPPARKRLPDAPTSSPSGRISAASVRPKVIERRAARLDQLERQPAAVLVADVDRRRRRLGAGEQPALRLVVVLHRPVQVEVILREVREDERVEAHPVEPVQRRAVRRGLDGDAPVARVEHLAEEPLQVDRLGRRVRRRAHLAADDPLDGADEPWLSALRPSRTDRSRNVVVVFPFVPVTPTTSSARVGSPKKASAAIGHRGAGVLDEQLRHVELERPLDDERDGTRRHRLAGEVVPVGPRARARRRTPRPA